MQKDMRKSKSQQSILRKELEKRASKLKQVDEVHEIQEVEEAHEIQEVEEAHEIQEVHAKALQHAMATLKQHQEQLREVREIALKGSSESREVAQEQAEEIVEQTRAMVEEIVENQKGAASARVFIAKSKDGKTFEWSGDKDEDASYFFNPGDKEDGHKRVLKREFIGTKGQFPSVGGKVEVGGPNTFHIHVERGDVHIHTNGASSITTSTSKHSTTSKSSKAAPPSPQFFAKAWMQDGAKPSFEMKFNGQPLEFDNLESILGAVGAGMSGLDVDIDFEHLTDIQGFVGNLEGALENLDLDGDMDFDFDFDFDFDGDDCDEDCDEDEDHGQHDAEDDGDRDERFVLRRDSRSRAGRGKALGFSLAIPAAKPASPARFFLSGGAAPVAARLAATAPALTAEEELLQLARGIQADVEAMRAELNELRQEVQSAPRRR